MVGAAAVMRLHIDRSFIRLDVGAGQQLAAHRSGHRHQHLSDGHHPAAHRGPADIDARVAQQGYALAIKWVVVTVLVHHRVDDHFIRHQALVDDPVRKRRSHHALLGTGFAGPLLALGHLRRSTAPARHPALRSLRSRSRWCPRPQLPHTHCSGVQAITRSTRGRSAGRV